MSTVYLYGEIAALVLSVCCVLGAYFVEKVDGFWTSAERIFALILLGVCLLFPLALIAFVVAFGLSAYHALAWANRHKIDLTNNPVMPVDLRIVVRNPKPLFDVTKIPHWLGWLVAYGVIVTTVGLLTATFYFLLQSDPALAAVRAAAFAAIAVHAYLAKSRFMEHLHWRFERDEFPFGVNAIDRAIPSWKAPIAMWTPSFNSKLSEHLGPLSFLIFKAFRKQHFEAPIYERHVDSASLPMADIVASVPHYERPETPNVVVLQLESVFNPNWAFRLSSQVNSFLFEKNEFTQFIVPLHVNIVGGGSWVTEFEVLTGLDTRLFGDDGLYTHVALADLIVEAFPSYVRRRGLGTFAFYPATGSFYNTRHAYLRYGFETFWDAHDLSLPEWDSTDTMIAEAFGRKLPDMGERPFFAFIVTNGAHSPFRKMKVKENEFRVSFSSPATPRMARTLRVYCRLLQESEQAVRSVLDQLRQLERTTGRPFVLLVYGDHQPWDFVTSKNAGFDALRTTTPKTQTFAHLMCSKGRFELASQIPATLLPSILSAFVARDAQDLYLPVNFYLLEQAGFDVFRAYGRRSPLARNLVWDEVDWAAAEAPAQPGPEQTAARRVRQAQRAAVRWLQTSGVLTV